MIRKSKYLTDSNFIIHAHHTLQQQHLY